VNRFKEIGLWTAVGALALVYGMLAAPKPRSTDTSPVSVLECKEWVKHEQRRVPDDLLLGTFERCARFEWKRVQKGEF